MKVTVQPYGGGAGIYIRDNAGSQRKTDSAGDFQYDVKTQTSGTIVFYIYHSFVMFSA